jgi:hypothetical protein
MSKNKDMLKIFFRVLKKDESAIKLVIPNSYVNNIHDIDYKKLKSLGINSIIFDIDNTIMPVDDINVTKELEDFINNLKKDFKICLLSNNSLKRVKPVSDKLNTLKIARAKKPKKYGFTKALKLLESTSDTTAVVGDQMLTDIVGANNANLYSILVEPVRRKYNIQTLTSRLLQNIIMLKLKDKIKKYQYY